MLAVPAAHEALQAPRPEGEPRKSLGHPGARIIDLDETGFEPRNWDELTTVALYRRFRAVPGFFGLE